MALDFALKQMPEIYHQKQNQIFCEKIHVEYNKQKLAK